jgi:hypothetical protein
MPGDVRRAGWTGVWAALALCGCNAAPAASAGGSVVDEVRAATDRSAARRDVVRLSNGMRMQRVSNPNGFSHVLVGRRGADGQPSVTCVDNAPGAASFLAGGQQGNGR